MYIVLAYYHFLKPPEAIEDPHKLVKMHLQFLKDKDVKARVYINEEGISGQMSIHEKDAESYMEWLHGFPYFKEMEFKVHLSEEHAFAKLTVKYRKELVALGVKVDMSLAGEHVSPQAWKEMIQSKDQNTILVDVRNHYEWRVGHFEGAILPNLETFRDFNDYIDQLKLQYNAENTKVMMYCTGGIRCEVYSALMKQKGFDTVYQLNGGVIKYGLEEGQKHWKGKLFVFDDRMVVSISEEEAEAISVCDHCGVKADVYYNCANMDCNELFISCPECAKKMQGCCCDSCITQPRVRPFVETTNPKPFRKLSFEQKQTYAPSQEGCLV